LKRVEQTHVIERVTEETKTHISDTLASCSHIYICMFLKSLFVCLFEASNKKRKWSSKNTINPIWILDKRSKPTEL